MILFTIRNRIDYSTIYRLLQNFFAMIKNTYYNIYVFKFLVKGFFMTPNNIIFATIFAIFFFSAIMFFYNNYLLRPLKPQQITALTGVKLELAQKFFKEHQDSYLSRKELKSMYRDYLINNIREEAKRKQREAIDSTSPISHMRMKNGAITIKNHSKNHKHSNIF